MSSTEVKGILEKQLSLLSEYSKKLADGRELAAITQEMVRVSEILLSSPRTSQPGKDLVVTLMVDGNEISRWILGTQDNHG